MDQFKLKAPYQPTGDQPQAIEALVAGFQEGNRFQTLHGVTGSGKTFTMAQVIQSLQRPTLVLSHNKTLAAQLFQEFKEYFPDNAVTYFVSYYDYYQPEAYIPQKDIYIEKDASINQDIERLRLAATASLASRRDVVVVASVSCIYGLGAPDSYIAHIINLAKDQEMEQDEFLSKLVKILYERHDAFMEPGRFRVRGDTVDIWPPYEEYLLRVQFFGDTIEAIKLIDPLNQHVIKTVDQIALFPARHFVLSGEEMEQRLIGIEEELEERLAVLKGLDHHLEAHRLEARTRYDMDMIRQTGFCPGIENYSRHLEGRPAGSRPYTLLDYFKDDWLMIIDESHVTLPQIGGMYAGDHSRKQTLVDHGFRLPSALDNRPMKRPEFDAALKQTLFVSATPGPEEARLEQKRVEQVIRPSGILDPDIEVRPTMGQIDDLQSEIQQRVEKGQRALVTTLTKKMSEDLSEFLAERGLKVHYLHSNIDAIDRTVILRELREGKVDVVVGVNLLREGLDLPEVSLLAILDADKEGFLRSETSLIQTIGRAARHTEGRVLMYADRVTDSMQKAIDETQRRRQLQGQYNQDHQVSPQPIIKEIRRDMFEEVVTTRSLDGAETEDGGLMVREEADDQLVYELERDMLKAAADLDFEKAAQLRDKIAQVKPDWNVEGQQVMAVAQKFKPKKRGRKKRRR